MAKSIFRGDPPVAHRHATLGGFARDERGQAATEYVLIVGLVGLAIALAFNKIQESLKALLARIVSMMNGPGI
jgi:Flp pilus assembly pilin Flp